MYIFPIIGGNKILGHYPSWWRYKYCEYKYLVGQGESIIGELETLFTYGGIGMILILGIERYTGWLAPWYYAPILVLVLRIMKICVGAVDRKYLKTGQAMQEYTLRAKLTPTGNEMWDRIKNIEAMTLVRYKKLYGIELTEEEKKFVPKTYKEIHTSVIEGRNENN